MTEPSRLPAPEQLLLRPADAARLMSCSRSRIYELMARRAIPVVDLAGTLRIPRAALLEWIEGHTVQPGDER